MICLDCNAAIAAFQKDPPANIAVYRERVRHFIRQNSQSRLLFPTIALSEYLWKADRADLDSEILRVVGSRMFSPSFDEVTASIAASLGRAYVADRKKLADVVRLVHDRVALRADLLIVATALQHSAKYLITNDDGCYAVTKFTGKITPILIRDLHDPPPAAPPPPPRPTGKIKNLFEDDPDTSGDPEKN